MKKLLLILLCLPMIGFGQLSASGNNDLSYYYPSEESVSDGGAYYDAGVTQVAPFLYDGHNYPDSIYAYNPIIQGYASLTYLSPNRIESVYLDIFPFALITLEFTYNSNNKVETFIILENGEGREHSFIYDSNNKLIEKNTLVIPTGEQYKKEFLYSNGRLEQMTYFQLPNTSNAIQTDVLTYNSSNQLEKIDISNGVTFKYGYSIATNFCENVTLYYNNNFIDTVITRNYDSNGNMVLTSIKEFDISTVPPTFDEHRKMKYTYDIYNRNIKEENFNTNTNQLNGEYADYIYFSTPTSIIEQSRNKELLKVTDLLGRETKQTNQPLFYIYNDGTVEKRIVIE